MIELSEKELTNMLISKDFGKVKGKPKFWKSLVTGKEYDYTEYINHGKGGIYRGFLDLPSDEYPYTLIYE